MIKTLALLLVTQWLIFSCTPAQERIDRTQESINHPLSYSNPNPDTLSELTPEQQTAFDALNSIQRQGQHLYSTFSGIHHDCFPPDTTFVISQSKLLVALEILLERYYINIEAEQRAKLANKSVLAQEEYLVLQCNGHSNGTMNDKSKNIPNSGSWILPEILGRRDVIIEW